MSKYIIKWEESVWLDLEIEADSREHALEKFGDNDYNGDDAVIVGSEIIADTIQIEEV